MKDALFAVVLAVAFTLVAYGAWLFSDGVGLIVGGFLLAVWGWLLLGDVS